VALVVDASTALTWCFADEAPSNDPQVLKAVHDEGAVVPAVWPIEVVNGVLLGLRRQRLDQAEVARFLELLGGLNIRRDEAPLEHAFTAVLNTGVAHNLTAYDACYVELAQRLGLRLITSNRRMAEAARTVGISLYP